MNKLQVMEQLGKAIQKFAQTLTSKEALEISAVFPSYKVGREYKENEMFTYGTNNVGDPQLYKVIQAHASQADWEPSGTPTLYEPLGLNNEGYPTWSRPSGVHDAYSNGDIVDYNGTLYKSVIDGNVYSPEEYPQGWEVV